jgi:N-acetylglucosaminyl-diphospho-decaprenol L-rhamnosyltransferase
MRIAVGVVAYKNSEEQLLRAKRSIERAWPTSAGRDVSWRNHSPTEERWPRELGPFVSWAPSNPGFGAGHNVLMTAAFGRGVDAYVCVNPDAALHRDCLRELCQMAERSSVGLVEARLFPEEHPKPYDRVTGTTEWCTGTVLLITRALFETVGGFDERFFLYCEDVDLSWRARAAGFSLHLAPRAIAFHYVEERGRDEWREQAVHRSAVLLGLKYGSRAFARAHRRAFLDEGGRSEELPLVEEESLPEGIADFKDGLRFARSRW